MNDQARKRAFFLCAACVLIVFWACVGGNVWGAEHSTSNAEQMDYIALVAEPLRILKSHLDYVFRGQGSLGYGQGYNVVVQGLADALFKYVFWPAFLVAWIAAIARHLLRIFRGEAVSDLSMIVRFWGTFLLALFLMLPARVFGIDVQDSRPLCMWLVLRGADLGMEAGGMVLDYVAGTLAAESESEAQGSSGAEAGALPESDMGTSASTENSANFTSAAQAMRAVQEFARAMFLMQTELGEDPTAPDERDWFLLAPFLYFRLQKLANQQANEAAQQIRQAIENDPDLRRRIEEAHVLLMEKTRKSKLIAALTGVLFLLIGTLVSGGAALSTLLALFASGSLGVAAGTATDLLNKFLLTVQYAVANLFFVGGAMVAFYVAAGYFLIRAVMLGLLAPILAFVYPFGEWGRHKLRHFGISTLALFGTPVLLAVFVFAVLVLKVLVVDVLSRLIVIVVQLVFANSALYVFVSMVAAVTAPVLFVRPVARIMLSANSYLQQLLEYGFRHVEEEAHQELIGI
ncbi:hypothetical protein [Thermosulfurimonas sp. F29]|uniref:hypothetical protein n=1 Tax=Thermosulfurimonas sp. F29 TaxID=2867247 RepID=UPI001C83FE55|nr:hypothetical protein [Thermosulfurimonas sp. F29]MBX6423392.1 hypothetical protein [Thermosulfurimonas sp. F29]